MPSPWDNTLKFSILVGVKSLQKILEIVAVKGYSWWELMIKSKMQSSFHQEGSWTGMTEKLCRAGAVPTSTSSSCLLWSVRKRLMAWKNSLRADEESEQGNSLWCQKVWETALALQLLTVSRGRWAMGKLGLHPRAASAAAVCCSWRAFQCSYLLVYSRKREAVGGSDFSRGFVFASN